MLLRTYLFVLFFMFLLVVGAVEWLFQPSLQGVIILIAALAVVAVSIVDNQRKNQEKTRERKHTTTFPNPAGGGPLWLYMYRPWHRELAQIGTRGKKSKK